MANFRYCSGLIRGVLLAGVILCACWMPMHAQSVPTTARQPVMAGSVSGDEAALDLIHTQLLKLLRVTPELTGAVAHDPSLLSDQPYVARTNPALAQFLQEHPEVARNPEFYLFAKVKGDDRTESLRREVWPEMIKDYHESEWDGLSRFLPPLIFLIALLWLIRLFLDNSRWKRVLKMQTEMQNKLLDKFASNQELITYLETEAGKRILQVSAMPTSGESAPRVGGILSRMLTPLQFGAVLISVGIGLEVLRRNFPNESGLVVMATLVLTLGIGLAVAALVSWLTARRYGLLPDSAKADAREQR